MSALKIKAKIQPVLEFDPMDARTWIEVFGFEPAAMMCVRLKGHMHCVPIQTVPPYDPALRALLKELIEGGGLPRLVQLMTTAVDYLAGHRKGPKKVLQRAQKYLPYVLAGVVHLSQCRFAFIEVGDINPATDHAPLKFHSTDCTSANELRVWITKHDLYAAGGLAA